MRKLFKKQDIAIIAAVLALCALLRLPALMSSDSPVAEIYVGSEKKYEIRLDEVEEKYTLTPTDKTEITVERGRICFSRAECRDKLCVNSGWLSSNGQTAACLPERVVITVTSGKKSPDTMTY